MRVIRNSDNKSLLKDFLNDSIMEIAIILSGNNCKGCIVLQSFESEHHKQNIISKPFWVFRGTVQFLLFEMCGARSSGLCSTFWLAMKQSVFVLMVEMTPQGTVLTTVYTHWWSMSPKWYVEVLDKGRLVGIQQPWKERVWEDYLNAWWISFLSVRYALMLLRLSLNSSVIWRVRHVCETSINFIC